MSINILFYSLILFIYFIISVSILAYVIFAKDKDTTQLKMIKCPDCGRKISINAKICKHCNSEILQNKEIVQDSIINNHKKNIYKKKKNILIIYQLIAGIVIVIGFDKINNMISQLLLLIALIINTITLIIFIIKYNSERKKFKYRLSIIMILAIICGIIFSVYFSFYFFSNLNYGYDTDIREILYLDTYNKKDAEILLNNIYSALKEDEGREVGSCLSLQKIWNKDTTNNTYITNIKETCEMSYLPPNAIVIEVNEEDKTIVEKIYWDFNDDINILLYENGNQVSEFKYLYNAMLHIDELPYYIKDNFEHDVKEQLKSPSSAIFTYNSFRYLESENRFFVYGWVEAQNSFGAIVKEDFKLKMIPCTNDYCEGNALDYEWDFE